MHTGCSSAVKLHCQGGKKKKKKSALSPAAPCSLSRSRWPSSADGSSGPRALTVNDLPQNESAQQRWERRRRERQRRPIARAEPPTAAQAPPPVFRDPALLGVPGAEDRGAWRRPPRRRDLAAGSRKCRARPACCSGSRANSSHLVSGGQCSAAGWAAGAAGRSCQHGRVRWGSWFRRLNMCRRGFTPYGLYEALGVPPWAPLEIVGMCLRGFDGKLILWASLGLSPVASQPAGDGAPQGCCERGPGPGFVGGYSSPELMSTFHCCGAQSTNSWVHPSENQGWSFLGAAWR